MSKTRAVVVASSLLLACHAGAPKYPWSAGSDRVPAMSADVHTLNENYDRASSTVLVRRVDRPTRAALDYAAYHANFMIADLPPENPPSTSGAVNTSNPFHGSIDKQTLTADVNQTPLTERERARPLAFAPLLQFLQSKRVAGSDSLEGLGSAVREESWGLPHGPESATQSLSEAFLHQGAGGGVVEIWAKIEFVPWFKALGDLPDQDGDGYPEVYGRVKADLVTPAVIDAVQKDYGERQLTAAEVKGWANQLASYWYPSFNTDLQPPGAAWPDDRTEADIKHQLGEHVFPAPTIVMRGKPAGKATYEVFLVNACGPGAPCTSESSPSKPATASGEARAHETPVKLGRSAPLPQTQAEIDAVGRELAETGGGSWAKWAAKVAPLDEVIRQKLRATPPKIKAFAGADGFLFYRNGLDYVAGGDLEKQRKGKNPLPIIVEFAKELKAHGVDFLFVPVPTKEEIFPDAIDQKFAPLVGQVVNPYGRKFLLSLGQAGVEVVDLLPAFLAARSGGDSAEKEPLYQHQDTHWTDRGLRMAAEIVGTRVRRYGWYAELSSHKRAFSTKETSFTRFGDLYSRLPDALKAPYKPETLTAHQVFGADGNPYEDDPDSPIVVLGDSFTGVYELTDAEHAGVSAHVAKAISFPVDLVMSYGGGPNVRQKLMRRGAGALGTKKLVIWMMTDRDLYNYWEDWEPLANK
jgi:SGNH hydrolase-like domain, acetyltransferase AlgX